MAVCFDAGVQCRGSACSDSGTGNPGHVSALATSGISGTY